MKQSNAIIDGIKLGKPLAKFKGSDGLKSTVRQSIDKKWHYGKYTIAYHSNSLFPHIYGLFDNLEDALKEFLKVNIEWETLCKNQS